MTAIKDDNKCRSLSGASIIFLWKTLTVLCSTLLQTTRSLYSICVWLRQVSAFKTFHFRVHSFFIRYTIIQSLFNSPCCNAKKFILQKHRTKGEPQFCQGPQGDHTKKAQEYTSMALTAFLFLLENSVLKTFHTQYMVWGLRTMRRTFWLLNSITVKKGNNHFFCKKC